MLNGHVLHARRGRVHVLRYLGRVAYRLAPSIKRYVDDLVDEAGAALVFDLTQAESLDSTNLGLLAHVAERVSRRGGARVMIVSTNEDINAVLLSMGFDQIFDLVSKVPEGDMGPELESQEVVEPGPSSEEDLHEAMLAAHRALAGLTDTSRVQFRDVVACLEARESVAGRF